METKLCINCGKEFIPTYSKQKYCGKSCAAIVNNKNRNIEKTIKYCEICGKEMVLTASSLHRKYCCRKCADIGRTTQVRKSCEVCGKEFLVVKQRNNTAKYCCRECADKAKQAEPNCTCPVCGKRFYLKPYHLRKHGHSLGNYCSKDCLNEARKTLFKGDGNHQYGLKGPLNASFKGQEITVQNHNLTEVMVYMPNHPYANHNGRVKKHRLIIEQNYQMFDSKYFNIIDGAYYLKPHISVHHLDNNHNNNVLENLIPCTKSEHRRYHVPTIISRDNKGRILKAAVLKQGELLGSPEVGNQQPSQPLTKLEGSETNS